MFRFWKKLTSCGKGSGFALQPPQHLPSVTEPCVLHGELIGCGLFLKEHTDIESKHVTSTCDPNRAPVSGGHVINPQASCNK